jgi:hypothetical protein
MAKDRRSGKNNLPMLYSLPIRGATRFAVRLHPEIGKELRNMFKAIATFRKPDEKLQVHRILKLFVEPVALFKYSASKKCCRCRNV